MKTKTSSQPVVDDIVDRLRGTLTSEPTDDAMWERIIRERREAADTIVALRIKLHRERSKRGHAIGETQRRLRSVRETQPEAKSP